MPCLVQEFTCLTLMMKESYFQNQITMKFNLTFKLNCNLVLNSYLFVAKEIA